MSVSMVALSSGRMLTTAVDGSVAAKVRNRLDGNLRLRNRQRAWEVSGKRAMRGGPGLEIKIFLLLHNGSVVKVSDCYSVLYASQTIEYC